MGLASKKKKKEDNPDLLHSGYESKNQTVRRRALVDQMLMNNKKADFTYATKKYRWMGEEGDFKSDDLTAYYRVYNQTQIDQKYKHLRNKNMKEENRDSYEQYKSKSN